MIGRKTNTQITIFFGIKEEYYEEKINFNASYSSSSQDVSSKAETESNSPYTVEADFSKGASNDFSISAGWSNGDPFNCSWSEDNVTFND